MKGPDVMEEKKKLWDEELKEILIENGVNISRTQMVEWVRRNRYIRSRPARLYRCPTKKATEMGLFYCKDKQITKQNGDVFVITNVYLTEKGKIYFLEKFKKLCEKE